MMPKRKFTVQKKLRMVEEAKRTNLNSTAQKNNIDRKQLREWMKHEVQLQQVAPSAYIISGGGRKLLSEEFEDLLCEKVLSTRLEKLRVTRNMITDWAKDFAELFGMDLSCSHGWLEKFMDRHDLVLRKATNKPVLADDEVVDRAARFVCHVKHLMEVYNIQLENIYALDETAIFFDHTRDRTVDLHGAKDIQVIHIVNISDQVISLRKT
jgi:hypothetical protein